jgi:hypothetical protein
VKKFIVRAGLASAGALALGATVGGADLFGVAHADTVRSHPDTDGYVAALVADGINPYPTSRSISVGYDVCSKLRSGISQSNLIEFLDATTSVPRSFIVDVVIDAHTYLCPDAPYDGSRGI